MTSALGWGALAASSLIVGALLGLARPWPDRAVGIVLAFGAGALVSAVSFDLAEEGLKIGSGAAVGGGLAVGALTYFGLDRLVERRGVDGLGTAAGLLDIRPRGGLDRDQLLEPSRQDFIAGRVARFDGHTPLEGVEPAIDRRRRFPVIRNGAVGHPNRIASRIHATRQPFAHPTLLAVFSGFDARHQRCDALRQAIGEQWFESPARLVIHAGFDCRRSNRDRALDRMLVQRCKLTDAVQAVAGAVADARVSVHRGEVGMR